MIASTGDVSHCLNAGGMGRIDYETETLIAHALDSHSAGSATEDGTGRGCPLVPIAFSVKDHGADAGDIAPTLRAGGHAGSHANGGCMPAVAFAHQAGGNHTSSGAFDVEMSPTLQRQQTMAVAFDARQSDVIQYGDMSGPLDTDGHTVAIGFEPRYYTRDNKTGGAPSDVAVLKADASKRGDSAPHVQTGMQVRRLTPRECERLQGFPDDYTLIPYRGRPAADGPRYKALGNSMAAPCMRWIGRRIQIVEALLRELSR